MVFLRWPYQLPFVVIFNFQMAKCFRTIVGAILWLTSRCVLDACVLGVGLDVLELLKKVQA